MMISRNQRRIMIITSDENIIDQVRKNNTPSSFETVILDSEEDIADLSKLLISKKTRMVQQDGIKNNVLTCVVCGSSAFGRHFGVIACESCKLFFRRNALKDPTTLLCRHDSHCQITFETRRRCLTCRLTKCLDSGMKPERLIKAEEKAAKRRKSKGKRSMILDPNLEMNPQSYDNSSTSSQSPCGFLSPEDLQRIELVQLAFEKRIELTDPSSLPWNPSSRIGTLLEFLNSRSVPAMRLLTFFKQIPEFTQLDVEDKIILTKYNLMSLVIFSLALSFNVQTKQIIETDTDAPYDLSIFQSVTGTQIFPHLKKLFTPLVHIAQCDLPEPILNDNRTVFHGQNHYTELLWKYMETVYGFERAVRMFSTLISQLLTWQILRKTLRANLQQTMSKTDGDELLPLMKSLFHTLER